MNKYTTAIKELRKEVYRTRKHAEKEARTRTTGGYIEAVKLSEWAEGIEWALDTIEYYVEHGRMP